ncbi:hypothetical protein O6H91_10G003100 [Diphasiastrum complanatum]|uniref:Uncharacterized protein n=1 Tax=Diphasiastrum complanatum TaxID=34168 RepID=A0ACC2CDW5_DIPCM|nr:hypothetical protein O6H91_10G003100 [Diphasiastrum complanatum]
MWKFHRSGSGCYFSLSILLSFIVIFFLSAQATHHVHHGHILSHPHYKHQHSTKSSGIASHSHHKPTPKDGAGGKGGGSSHKSPRSPLPNNGLLFDFYSSTCPQAESVVMTVVQGFVSNDITLAPALLRLHFHDCMTRGCDGSILLSTDGSKTPPEKAAAVSFGLRGFDVIEAIKAELEKECPRTVSCADIVALAARDAATMIGGPFWPEPLGRRDGFVSRSKDTVSVPNPDDDLGTLVAKFAAAELDVLDLVALSGVHTVGRAHCVSFADRLSHKPDPTLNRTVTSFLRRKCDIPRNSRVLVNNDFVTPFAFDNQYYLNILSGQVLFSSDEELLSNKATRALVETFAGNVFAFTNQFSTSIIKMGNANVLIGSKGNIRKTCSSVL